MTSTPSDIRPLSPRDIKTAIRAELKRAIYADLDFATCALRETWDGDGFDILAEGDVYWRRERDDDGDEHGAHYYSVRVSGRTDGGPRVELSGGWYDFDGSTAVEEARPRRFGRIVFWGPIAE